MANRAPDQTGTGGGRATAGESYVAVLSHLAGVLVVLGALGVLAWRRARPEAPPPPPLTVSAAVVSPEAPAPQIETDPAPPAGVPVEPRPQLDRARVAQAEAELESARRARLDAEARASEADALLKRASIESAARALSAKTLASRVRDPGARIARAMERSARLRDGKARLESEIAGLARAPRPKRKSLTDRTPVAKPAEGKEYHFEVRRDRVAFIDLERLLDMVGNDARLRIRMSDGDRSIVSTVGPVGPFSLQYELAKGLPTTVEDLLEQRGQVYSIRSCEVVPEFEGRGETFEMAFRPASDFARAIHRLTPARATITMWVYPDGFALYRKLRDALHARGFLVAARPLPAGQPIRCSPSGSVSAGQ